MFFISRFKESNDKTYVDTNMTGQWKYITFSNNNMKNANIKQFNLNKIISWVGLRVLAQRNTTKLPTQKA